MRTEVERAKRHYLDRAVHLALLFMMQCCFTLYSLCVLLVIAAPTFLWVFWVFHQFIGWMFFSWQFVAYHSSVARITELEEENKELKTKSADANAEPKSV